MYFSAACLPRQFSLHCIMPGKGELEECLESLGSTARDRLFLHVSPSTSSSSHYLRYSISRRRSSYFISIAKCSQMLFLCLQQHKLCIDGSTNLSSATRSAMPGIATIQPPGDAMVFYNHGRCRNLTTTVLQNKVWQRFGLGRLCLLYGRSKHSTLLESSVNRLVLMIVEQIVGFPGPFITTKWIQTGLGKHIECLGPARALATVQWSMATQALNITCLGLVKVSLCLCVLRVIDRVERRIATFLWVNIALVGAIHIAQLAMVLAECRPLNALWDLRVHGRCYSPNTAYTTTYVAFSKTSVT